MEWDFSVKRKHTEGSVQMLSSALCVLRIMMEQEFGHELSHLCLGERNVSRKKISLEVTWEMFLRWNKHDWNVFSPAKTCYFHLPRQSLRVPWEVLMWIDCPAANQIDNLALWPTYVHLFWENPLLQRREWSEVLIILCMDTIDIFYQRALLCWKTVNKWEERRRSSPDPDWQRLIES